MYVPEVGVGGGRIEEEDAHKLLKRKYLFWHLFDCILNYGFGC